MTRGRKLPAGVGLFFGLLLCALPTGAFAATPPAAPIPSDFNLQVTPSPLVTSVKPGVRTVVPLKIRNGGSGTENLKIAIQAFTYNSDTGQVDLKQTASPEAAAWTSFSAPNFSISPGEWFTDTVTFDTPKTAGFSYSFAVVISRQKDAAPTGGQRVIKGSVAVFSLINVDRPGATSSLKVVNFSSKQRLYEYLPATFNVRFQNTGNTIVQPLGNIFVARSATAKTALATLIVNEKHGYILPGTSRTVSTSWNDGFAVYKTDPSTASGTSGSKHLSIDWSELSHFRIGRYTAHLVAVYSDGRHDIPIEGTVSFWVIPWRAMLLFVAVVVLLWLFARWRGKRRTEKAVKRALAAQAAAHEATQKTHASKPEEKKE